MHHQASGDKSEHIEVLGQALNDQQGELAVAVVNVLYRNGDRTLHEIFEGVKGTEFHAEGNVLIADEQWVKRVVAVLVQHQVVAADQNSKLYTLQLGKGLFRVLIPLVLDFVKVELGDAAELLMSIMFEYSALPLDTLHSIATKRFPSLATALKRAADQLREQSLLVIADDEGPRPEKEKRVALDRSIGMVYIYNVQGILTKMRSRYIADYLKKRFGAIEPVKIFNAFLHSDSNRPSTQLASWGYPPLSDFSSPMTWQAVAKKCEGCNSQELDTFVGLLQSADGDSLVTVDRHSQYSFNYAQCVRIMKRDLCRDVVFARHGMLGLRILRILEERSAMEDRHLAEECIATLPETRDVLRAMMVDGFVRQQELPRIANAERQPKHSIVLWVFMPEILTQFVAKVVLKSLRTLKTRLDASNARFSNMLPRAYIHDQTTPLTADDQKIVKQMKQNEEALRRALLSLQETLLVIDFF